MKQTQLIKSSRYQIVFDFLLEIYNLNEKQVEQHIEDNMPHLLDANYMGHDENGSPCKTVRFKK